MLGVPDFPWWLSVATQAGLFFKYLALWLWPDTGAMSIDLRINFADAQLPPMVLLAVAGFLSYGLMGLYLLTRRVGAARIAGFGLLFPWILFLVEFATIRIQEPFVLYRSYLWAPGLMMALAAALTRVSVRAATAMALLVFPLLFYQAHERLRTFTSELALWEDAVAKLPRGRVPGGSRTLYSLGREYLYAGRPDSAIAVVDRCLAEYPATYQCPFARAAIHLHLEQYPGGAAISLACDRVTPGIRLRAPPSRGRAGKPGLSGGGERAVPARHQAAVCGCFPPPEPHRVSRQRTSAADQAKTAHGRVRQATARRRRAAAALSRASSKRARAVSSD